MRSSGDAATALLASCAIPGVFPPWLARDLRGSHRGDVPLLAEPVAQVEEHPS
jgi:predicted acylesterase/phospholipase RssA